MKRCILLFLLFLRVFNPLQGQSPQTLDSQDNLKNESVVPLFKDATNATDHLILNPDANQNISMDFFSDMEGALPGVDVTSVGAEPGAFVRMLLRGVGSVNASNEPLIVIDGVPFENNTLNAGGYRYSGIGELDAADFESVKILKGAASTAFWGARGANGVILITTKREAKQDRRINLSYRQGVSSSPRKLDLLNSDQYIDVLNRAYQNSFPSLEGPAPINQHTFNGFYSQPYTDEEGQVFQPNLSSTNWYDNMYTQGINHHIRGSFHGGDENTSYFLGGTYRSDQSFLYGGNYDRANFRLNILNQTNDRLKLGLNLYVSTTRRDVNSRQWFETAHTTALPVYPVQSPENPVLFWYNENYPVNLEALDQHSWNKTGGIRTFNTGFAEYDLFGGLSVRSQWSWDYQHYLNEDYKHPYVSPSANGLLIIGRQDRSNWSGNNSLNYTTNLGLHSVNAVAGFSMENFGMSANTIYNPGMTLIFVHSNGESNQTRLAWTNVENYRFYSGYASLAYDYDQRYKAHVTLRNDASSRFGKDNRNHIFPAASLAWTLSNESFLQDNSFVDFLQVQAGYGITGNAMMRNFLHLSSMGPHASNNPNSQGYYGYGDYPAVVPVNMGNANLGPEKSEQLDAGVTFSVLQNRLTGSVNYFAHNNFDLLIPVPISILYGYENTYRWENDGELKTEGIELWLAPQIISSQNGLNWRLDLNLTSVNTTLTRLPDRVDYIEGYFNRTYPGDALGGYYLAEWAGVDPETGHELIINPETGEQTNAELLNESEFLSMATYNSDKTPFPNLYGGLRNTLSFRNFEMSFLFTLRQGHYLLDLGEQSLSYVNSGSTGSTDLLEGWSGDNPSQVPLLYNSQMSQRVTSRFLHDASYIRLQQVYVGYTLPSNIFGWNYNQDVTIYFSGNNLLTFTDFPGYDPNGIHSAYNSMSSLDAGLLMFDPPNPRTFMLGISVGL